MCINLPKQFQNHNAIWYIFFPRKKNYKRLKDVLAAPQGTTGKPPNSREMSREAHRIEQSPTYSWFYRLMSKIAIHHQWQTTRPIPLHPGFLPICRDWTTGRSGMGGFLGQRGSPFPATPGELCHSSKDSLCFQGSGQRLLIAHYILMSLGQV